MLGVNLRGFAAVKTFIIIRNGNAMRVIGKYSVILLILLLVVGCGGKKARSGKTSYGKLRALSVSDGKVKKMLMAEFRKWKGTPHVMGGNTRKGVDCSGFIHQMYKRVFGVAVPRSTKLLMGAGGRIKKSQLRPGDIVLFKPPTYLRHVGIYVGNNKFIHASKSKGITLTDLNNSYWKKCYYSSRRVLKRS